MTVEDAVVGRLLSWPAVAALVSDRVYQLVLPQSPTLPAIRVQVIDDPLRYHQRGPDGAMNARVQTDIYVAPDSGTDPKGIADSIAAVLLDAMSGKIWTVTGTPDSREVTGAFQIDRRSGYEFGEITAVRVIQDWSVWSRTV